MTTNIHNSPFEEESFSLEEKMKLLKEQHILRNTLGVQNEYEVVTKLSKAGRKWYFTTSVHLNGKEMDAFDFPPEKGYSKKGEIGGEPPYHFVKRVCQTHFDQCKRVATLLTEERWKREQKRKGRRIKILAFIGICSLFVIGALLSVNPDIVDRVAEMLRHLNDSTPTPTPTLTPTPFISHPNSTQVPIRIYRVFIKDSTDTLIQPTYSVKPGEKLTISVNVTKPPDLDIKVICTARGKVENYQQGTISQEGIEYQQQGITYTAPKDRDSDYITVKVLDAETDRQIDYTVININIIGEP